MNGRSCTNRLNPTDRLLENTTRTACVQVSHPRLGMVSTPTTAAAFTLPRPAHTICGHCR